MQRPLGELAHVLDEQREVADVLERPGLVHPEPGERPGDQHVDPVARRRRRRAVAAARGVPNPAFPHGACQMWRRPVDAATEPGCELAFDLAPVQRPWALVLEQQHVDGPLHGDPEERRCRTRGASRGEARAWSCLRRRRRTASSRRRREAQRRRLRRRAVLPRRVRVRRRTLRRRRSRPGRPFRPRPRRSASRSSSRPPVQSHQSPPSTGGRTRTVRPPMILAARSAPSSPCSSASWQSATVAPRGISAAHSRRNVRAPAGSTITAATSPTRS